MASREIHGNAQSTVLLLQVTALKVLKGTLHPKKYNTVEKRVKQFAELHASAIVSSQDLGSTGTGALLTFVFAFARAFARPFPPLAG